MLPGYFGGANWGGAAFDPETGILYVPSLTISTVMGLTPGDPNRTDFRYRGGGGRQPNLDRTRGSREPVVAGLPIFKPPYARVTAIDMHRGEHLWMRALGNGPRNHPLLKDLDLGPLGDAVHRASALVTKTLVFVSVSRLLNNAVPSPPAWAEWGDSRYGSEADLCL